MDSEAPRGVNGMATVRARYEKGILTLLEPLDLAEGAEVTVAVAVTEEESAARVYALL